MNDIARRMSFQALVAASLVALCLGIGSAVSQDAVDSQESGAPDPLRDGEALVMARAWDRAENWFYDYTRENPDDAHAWRRLGYVEIHRAGGDAVRARQYLDRAFELEPDDAIGRVLSARLYHIAEDLGSAAEFYDLVIEAGPGERDPLRSSAHHVAHFNRGVVAVEQGDFATAVPHFERVLARQPRQAYALYEQAGIAREVGDLDAAVDFLQRAKEGLGLWAPVELWAYPQHRYNSVRDNIDYELGRTLVGLGRFDEAREILTPLTDMVRLRSKTPPVRKRAPDRNLLERHEDDVRFQDAPFFLAEALAGVGETKEAIATFKEFSRMKVGTSKARSAAKARAKELK